MGLLLYKSNEMFSATELIRKSKMIFDKIIEKKIDKAIILRDGKPSFLLMDFEKYEKIMAEFEELKQNSKTKTKPEKIKSKEKKKNTKVEKTIVKEIEEKQPTQNTPLKEESVEIEEETEKAELSEEEEIGNAFLTIEGMNFTDEMKKEAQDKIRIKVLQARKERAELLALQEQELQEEDKEELEIKQHIEQEKLKKQRELKEFWD